MLGDKMGSARQVAFFLVLCACMTCCGSDRERPDESGTTEMVSDDGTPTADVVTADILSDSVDDQGPDSEMTCGASDFCIAGLGKPTLDAPDDVNEVRDRLPIVIEGMELIYQEDATVTQVLRVVDDSNSAMTIRRRALGPIPAIAVGDAFFLTTGPDMFRLENDERVVIEWMASNLVAATDIDMSWGHTSLTFSVVPGPICDGSSIHVNDMCMTKAMPKIAVPPNEYDGFEGFEWISGAASGSPGLYFLVDTARGRPAVSDPIRFAFLKIGWDSPEETEAISYVAPTSSRQFSRVPKATGLVDSRTSEDASCPTAEETCLHAAPWFSLSGNANADYVVNETVLLKDSYGVGLQHFRLDGFDQFSRGTFGGAVAVLPGTPLHVHSERGFDDSGEMMVTRGDRLVDLSVIEPYDTDVAAYTRTFEQGDVTISVKTAAIGTEIIGTFPQTSSSTCTWFVRATLEITVNDAKYQLTEGEWVSTDDFVITVPMAAAPMPENCVNYTRHSIAYEYVSRVW